MILACVSWHGVVSLRGLHGKKRAFFQGVRPEGHCPQATVGRGWIQAGGEAFQGQLWIFLVA